MEQRRGMGQNGEGDQGWKCAQVTHKDGEDGWVQKTTLMATDELNWRNKYYYISYQDFPENQTTKVPEGIY